LTDDIQARVLDAMRDVIDPELAINVVELGMVGEIEVDEGRVLVPMRLTSMSCPFWDLFVDQVQAAVGNVDGVREVAVRFDRHHPWTPDLMSAAARAHLEAVGLMPPSVRQPPNVGRSELLQLARVVLSAPRFPENEREKPEAGRGS
jgi:metal-sulfur cluster biosynthetic enzyme